MPGLLAVPRVMQHDDLPDPCHHGIRRRLLLSLRHRTLRALADVPSVPTLTAATGNPGEAGPTHDVGPHEAPQVR
ncbi:hypothetical protein SSP24_46920 [Streptomyces spinoverrucosus]|uniref:Uncharacterized protein n=1 Tax=Streptomyces spinoverrucosus TaxID=284043 RepID=A0A4Y3VJK2_9ACTN|nr:hypothetical protein SSP24_46920 [Streptomyces spinoverrucosus]GHB92471.1 hypothetical protein GCM10010397_76170 [Streptomyces spinoverrucosus]